MSWESPSAVLTPTLVRSASDWVGEGCQNETVPLDIGVELRFERPRPDAYEAAAGEEEEDPEVDDDEEPSGVSPMQIIARNRRGVDLSGKEGHKIQGKLEIDVASMWDYGLSDEELTGDQSSASHFSAAQDDDRESDMRFELTMRGRIAIQTEVVDDKIFDMTLETPFGFVLAHGHLPTKLYQRGGGKMEDLKPEHYAEGQWVTLKGFPCFDIVD